MPLALLFPSLKDLALGLSGVHTSPCYTPAMRGVKQKHCSYGQGWLQGHHTGQLAGSSVTDIPCFCC